MITSYFSPLYSSGTHYVNMRSLDDEKFVKDICKRNELRLLGKYKEADLIRKSFLKEGIELRDDTTIDNKSITTII